MPARATVSLVVLFLCITSFLTPDASAQACYKVGSWNLEAFFDGSRGFPGPSLRKRTKQDLRKISRAIKRDIGASILALSEIDGDKRGRRPINSSNDLKMLVSELGNNWDYRIAKSGGNKRVAILWNKSEARLNGYHEIFIKEKKIREPNRASEKAKDFFDRDPLIGHFTFLKNGREMNDLTVVALHLASQQWRVRNHDLAMKRLRGELRGLRGKVSAYPADEDDILVTGDMNSSPFNKYKDTYFKRWNRGNWKLLVKDKQSYPYTRLNVSWIDFIFVTRNRGRQNGLWGEEIRTVNATVHRELASEGIDKFREIYSDHFPVTTCIKITNDTDR